MDVRNGRSLLMDSVKFKLGKDFEVPNFEYFVLDYGLEVLGICNINYLVWEENHTVYVVWIHNKVL